MCFALGVYLCYLIVSYAWKKEGRAEDVLNKVVIWLLVALIVGARLGHCLFYEPDYYLSNPLEILKTWKGVVARHGAAVALPITVYILSRKYDFNWVWFLDRLAIGVALAGSFIRLGNFFNSEIYGIETTLPWGVIFVRNGETVPKRHSCTNRWHICLYLCFSFVSIRKKAQNCVQDSLPGCSWCWCLSSDSSLSS